MSAVRVDVWSDLACPWCYIGKRRLDAAIARYGGEVEVVWHAFELDPNAELKSDLSQVQLLAQKYGMSPSEAQATMDRVTQTAAGDGIEMKLGQVQRTNTFDAHRVLRLAFVEGGASLQHKVKERLFHGYFNQGKNLGDRGVLAALAAEAGLDGSKVAAALDDGEHALDVRTDEDDARQIGIRGVPFFVFDEKLAVSGAQPVEQLLAVLQESKPLAEGAACGVDGC